MTYTAPALLDIGLAEDSVDGVAEVEGEAEASLVVDEGMAFEAAALARSLLDDDSVSVDELGRSDEPAGDEDLLDEATGVACLGAAAAFTLVGVGLSDEVECGFSGVEAEEDGAVIDEPEDGAVIDELILRGVSSCLYAAANAGEGAIAALDAALAVVF